MDIYEKRPDLSGVYITKGALDEIQAYARISNEEAKKEVGLPAECYGYLIKPKTEERRLVRRSFFAYNQDVNSAHVEIHGEDVIKCSNEIFEMGYRVLGPWHSHADMAPSHSEIDDRNLLRMLNRISKSNYVMYYYETELFSQKIVTESLDDRIRMKEVEEEFGRILDIGLATKDLSQDVLKNLNVEYAKLKFPVKLGFACSIVVNAHGSKPYAEIATRDWLKFFYINSGEDGKKMPMTLIDNHYPTEVCPVEVDDDIEPDEDKIRADVRKKLKIFQKKGKVEGESIRIDVV